MIQGKSDTGIQWWDHPHAAKREEPGNRLHAVIDRWKILTKRTIVTSNVQPILTQQ